MSDSKPPQTARTTIIIAAIGASATVCAAIIGGMFGLFQNLLNRPQANAVETATVTAVSPTDPPAVDLPGLAFATRVDPDGRAQDPGNTFPADIADFYPVFLPGSTPPGLQVSAPDPDSGAYYAFLKSTGSTGYETLGWRWIRDGVVLNEFASNVSEDVFWLQRFDYDPGGIFNNNFGPGPLTIVILMGGTPFTSAEVTITP